MRINAARIGLLAVVFALSLGAMTPASAEFFGRHDEPGQLLASHDGSPSAYRSGQVSSSRYTREFAAQARPRITIHPRTSYPGPNAKRYCRSWLAKEYRLSGTVIVPRMQCWWQ
jgi:hypothetical protein